MAAIKRKKSSPFSKEDELRLVEAIYAKKNIIENKETNKVINADKDKAWEQVGIAFNAGALEFRSVDQLKSKFDNLKTKIRKMVAQERNYLIGTGGGGAPHISNDPVNEIILKIIDWKTVVGLGNSCDSDNVAFENNFIGNDLIEIVRETEDTYCNDGDLVTTMNDLEGSDKLDTHCKQIKIVATPSMHSYPHKFLGELKPLNDLTNVKLVTSKENVEVYEASASQKKNRKEMSELWSSYTPRKLKEPISKKLRPTIISPLAMAKEEYYKKKTLFLEGETRLRQDQNRREEEDHLKKQILLDLEIELKKEELKKCLKN